MSGERGGWLGSEGGRDLPFDDIVKRALAEDLRSGDATTRAVVPADRRGRADLVAREGLVACGLAVAERCFASCDPDVDFQALVTDGERVDAGTRLARVAGSLAGILSAERTALNFVQRMSGIATATRSVVEAVAHTSALVLDTRKTVPGLRGLDKQAVRAGGGTNHRMALDDLIMVKDNHVAAAGSLALAVERALDAAGSDLQVEIEVDTFDQLDEILSMDRKPHAVLLDNFRPHEVRDAVERIRKSGAALAVEVSGGITHDNIVAHAEAGPDAISLGALTHSVRAADVALDWVVE